jgi:ATP-dependent DNA helicase PIF1
MLDADTFDALEHVARTLRGSDKPFGGIQLVIAGDFLQLPPVGVGEAAAATKFCFQAKSWDKVQAFSTSTQFQQ